MSLNNVHNCLNNISNTLITSGNLERQQIENLKKLISKYSNQKEEEENEEKYEKNRNNNKDIKSLLYLFHDVLDSVEKSFTIQKNQWKTQLKNVRQQSQDAMMANIQAIRTESRTSVGTLTQQIEELQVENQQLLMNLGMGENGEIKRVNSFESNTNTNIGSISIKKQDSNDSTLPEHDQFNDDASTTTHSTVGRLSTHSYMPRHHRMNIRYKKGGTSASLASITEGHEEATVFECLRLHKQISECNTEIANLEHTNSELEEEISTLKTELESASGTNASLKRALDSAERHLQAVKLEHEAELRRLASESVAQQTKFREIMAKFRSQVETEMSVQRDKAHDRLMRERDALSSAAAIERERMNAGMDARIHVRLEEQEAKFKSQLASTRHMHKQELGRVLSDNERLRKIVHSTSPGVYRSKSLYSPSESTSIGVSPQSNSNSNSRISHNGPSPNLSATVGRRSSPVSGNDMPWGSDSTNSNSSSRNSSRGSRNRAVNIKLDLQDDEPLPPASMSEHLEELMQHLGPEVAVAAAKSNNSSYTSSHTSSDQHENETSDRHALTVSGMFREAALPPLPSTLPRPKKPNNDEDAEDDNELGNSYSSQYKQMIIHQNRSGAESNSSSNSSSDKYKNDNEYDEYEDAIAIARAEARAVKEAREVVRRENILRKSKQEIELEKSIQQDEKEYNQFYGSANKSNNGSKSSINNSSNSKSKSPGSNIKDGREINKLTLADLAKQPLRSPPASNSVPRSYSQIWDQKKNNNINNSNLNEDNIKINLNNNELKNSVRFADEESNSGAGMVAAVSLSMTCPTPTKSETTTEDIIEASEVSQQWQEKLGDDGAALLGGYFDGDTRLGDSLDETMEAAIDQIR